jgi:hypothetical protein
MSIASSFPTIKPSLLLDFANVGALDPRITFTRASTGTYYDGVTTAKAEQNLLLQSQDFTTSWTTEDATITANTEVAPDGTTTADTITENTANTDHRVKSGAISFVSGQSYVISVFAKNGDADFIQMVLPSTAFSGKYANFDIDTGVVGSFDATTATITLVGNGWYRLVVTATATSTTTVDFSIGLANSSSLARLAAYTGTSRFAYLWGAQVEQRSSVTAYTATTTQPITNYIPVLQTAAANVARFDHTPTTGEALGLLVEEQRTNLLTYSANLSNAAWTSNRGSITSTSGNIAPDGTQTANVFTENTASGAHYVFQNFSASVGQTFTLSCYFKKKERQYAVLTIANGSGFPATVFDLVNGVITDQDNLSATIEPAGNGWYRCSIKEEIIGTSTIRVQVGCDENGDVNPYTGDGYSGIFIWGAQLEAAAFATSYIATTSAQVTRSADSASMTGANFSSWFNAGESTVYSEFMRNTTANAIAGGGNTVPRIYSFGTSASGNLQLRLFASTGAEATGPSMYISNTWAANQYNKHALAFEVNDAALVRDGGSVVSDSTVTALTADTLAIGQNTIGSGNIGQGWIRKLSYYPQRLTNAQLQALTS